MISGIGSISPGLVSSMVLVLDSVSVSLCSGESPGDENSVVAWGRMHVLLVFAGSGSVDSGCVSYGGNQNVPEPEPDNNFLYTWNPDSKCF